MTYIYLLVFHIFTRAYYLEAFQTLPACEQRIGKMVDANPPDGAYLECAKVALAQ